MSTADELYSQYRAKKDKKEEEDTPKSLADELYLQHKANKPDKKITNVAEPEKEEETPHSTVDFKSRTAVMLPNAAIINSQLYPQAAQNAVQERKTQQYIQSSPRVKPNANVPNNYSTIKADYDKKVADINASDKDDNTKNDYLQEAQLEYEVKLLEERARNQKIVDKGIPGVVSPKKQYDAGARKNVFASDESKDLTEAKELLESKRAQLDKIQKSNRINSILSDPEVSSLVADLSAEEVYKENTAITSMFNPSYAQGRSLASSVDSAIGNESLTSKAFTARQKLIDMGYDPDELLEQYTLNKNKAVTEELSTEFKEFGKEHPALGTALSFPAKAASGMGVAAVAKAALTGREVDPNSPYFIYSNIAEGMREGASSDMGSVGKFAYNIGTTLGDMAITQAVAGGNPLTYKVLMASQSAASSAKEGAQKGYSVGHVFVNSATSAALTAVCEHLGYDKVFNPQTAGTAKELFKNVLKGFLAEGLEEASEETLNTIVENATSAAFTGQSDINKRISELMAQGMSEDQAKTQAVKEIAEQVGQSFVVGGISGGLMSGAKSIPGYIGSVVEREINKTPEAPTVENQPLTAEVETTPQTVPTAQQNAQNEAISTDTEQNIEQNTDYANEFDNLYDENVEEEDETPSEEVDTTVGEDGTVYFEFDDDTDFDAVNEEIKTEYDTEENADLKEITEPYSSGNAAVDAMLNPNGRLDRKITVDEQAEQKLVDMAQKWFNRKVVFKDTIPSGNGYYDPDTGEIVIARDSDQKYVTVFGHEFLHSLEGTHGYDTLTTFLKYNSPYIKNKVADYGSWKALVDNKVNDYKQAFGKELTTSEAEYEIYADAIAEEFFSDYKTMESLATQNRSMFTKLKQWFYTNVVKMNEQTRVYGKNSAARKTYALMLRAERMANGIQSREGVAYSAKNNLIHGRAVNQNVRYSAKNPEIISGLQADYGYSEASANNIYRVAKTLKQNTESEADIEQLTSAIVTSLENRKNGDIDSGNIERIAMMLAENAQAVNESYVSEYKPIMDYLKGTKISISKADISDLGDAFSYVKQRLFPQVTLAKEGGTPVDTVFQELSARFPNAFDAENITHPADQVKAIAGFIEEYRDNYYFKPYFEGDEAYTQLRDTVSELVNDKLIDNSTYLKRLAEMRNTYGELKNGIPQSTDGETRVRRGAASIYGTETVQKKPERVERFVRDFVNGKHDYTVMRQGQEAKAYIDKIKASDNVTETIESEYSRLRRKLTSNERLRPIDIVQAHALNPLLGDILSDDDYVEFTMLVTETGTESAQITSSFRLISQFSGAQKLKSYHNKLDQINAERSKGYPSDAGANAVVDENGQFKITNERSSESKTPESKGKKGFIELTVSKKQSKYPPIEIPARLEAELAKAKSQAEIDAATDKINKYLAEQIHPTWFDKFNAWRYFAMLSNPKTAVRNTVGNIAMSATARMKDTIAAAISATPLAKKYKDGSVQTSAVKTTKEARNAATQIIVGSDALFDLYSGQDKYTGRTVDFQQSEAKLGKLEQKIAERNPLLDTIFHKRSIQQSDMARTGRAIIDKPLGKLSEYQQKALDDTLFKVLRSKSVLSQSITAAIKNGDIENINDFLAVGLDGNTEHLDNATKVRYARLFDRIVHQAAKEGDESTFRDDNEFADALNKFAKGNSKGKRVLSIAVDALIPFKKTPANIVKRGYEYSPVALGVSLVSDRVKLAKGEIDRNTYINNIAKGATGTIVFAVGALLSRLGVLNVGDDDEEEEAERTMLGGQQYALNIGNGSYTIDFLAPAALPLFMGGKVYETIVSLLNGDDIAATEFLFDILQGVAEPMFAQTMLSGIDGAFEAISRESAHNDSEGASSIALVSYCAENWVNQFIPSVFGAIARTADDTVRGYYKEKGKEETLLGDLMVGAKKKIPLAANTTPAKLNMWGQPIKSGSLGERFLENFISPGYYQESTSDKATKALHKFATDNDIAYTDVIPQEVPNYFKLPNKTEITLTAEEYEKYAGIVGKARKEAVEKYLVRGEPAEVEYNYTVIKSSLKSGRKTEKRTFKGNIATATNRYGWSPTNSSEGYIQFNDKGKAIGTTAASNEEFRKMLFDEVIKQVTDEAEAKAQEEIMKARNNK